MIEGRTTTYSTDELLRRKGKTRTDAPEGPDLGPDFWAQAQIVVPDAPKEQITIRLDADVLQFFKKQGRGYQTRMNAVLRSYYEASKGAKRSPKGR